MMRGAVFAQQLAVALLRIGGDFPAASRDALRAQGACAQLLGERDANGDGAAVIDDAAALPQGEHAGGFGRRGDQSVRERKTCAGDRHAFLPPNEQKHFTPAVTASTAIAATCRIVSTRAKRSMISVAYPSVARA